MCGIYLIVIQICLYLYTEYGTSYRIGDTSSCNAYQKPKLPIFSGEEKSETSFDVWKLEVKCVLREGSSVDDD